MEHRLGQEGQCCNLLLLDEAFVICELRSPVAAACEFFTSLLRLGKTEQFSFFVQTVCQLDTMATCE